MSVCVCLVYACPVHLIPMTLTYIRRAMLCPYYISALQALGNRPPHSRLIYALARHRMQRITMNGLIPKMRSNGDHTMAMEWNYFIAPEDERPSGRYKALAYKVMYEIVSIYIVGRDEWIAFYHPSVTRACVSVRHVLIFYAFLAHIVEIYDWFFRSHTRARCS